MKARRPLSGMSYVIPTMLQKLKYAEIGKPVRRWGGSRDVFSVAGRLAFKFSARTPLVKIYSHKVTA